MLVLAIILSSVAIILSLLTFVGLGGTAKRVTDLENGIEETGEKLVEAVSTIRAGIKQTSEDYDSVMRAVQAVGKDYDQLGDLLARVDAEYKRRNNGSSF